MIAPVNALARSDATKATTSAVSTTLGMRLSSVFSHTASKSPPFGALTVRGTPPNTCWIFGVSIIPAERTHTTRIPEGLHSVARHRVRLDSRYGQSPDYLNFPATFGRNDDHFTGRSGYAGKGMDILIVGDKYQVARSRPAACDSKHLASLFFGRSDRGIK